MHCSKLIHSQRCKYSGVYRSSAASRDLHSHHMCSASLKTPALPACSTLARPFCAGCSRGRHFGREPRPLRKMELCRAYTSYLKRSETISEAMSHRLETCGVAPATAFLPHSSPTPRRLLGYAVHGAALHKLSGMGNSCQCNRHLLLVWLQ